MTRDQVRDAAAWACAGAAVALGTSAIIAQVFFARTYWTIYAIGHHAGAFEALRAVDAELHGLAFMAHAVWAMGAIAVALAAGAYFLGRAQAGVRWLALLGVIAGLWALGRQFWLDDTIRWT